MGNLSDALIKRATFSSLGAQFDTPQDLSALSQEEEAAQEPNAGPDPVIEQTKEDIEQLKADTEKVKLETEKLKAEKEHEAAVNKLMEMAQPDEAPATDKQGKEAMAIF